jgi:hypothetical protein
MDVDGMKIPAALLALVENGNWPAEPPGYVRRIPLATVRRLVDDENEIYLCAPPFRTIAELRSQGTAEFWDEMAALHEIDASKAILIAEFEIGSDSMIVLDYRENPSDPQVLRLKWAEPFPAGNRWEILAPDFAHFAEALGLKQIFYSPRAR